MTAAEARQKTLYNQHKVDGLEEIYYMIDSACNEGKTYCLIDKPINQKTADILRLKGFSVKAVNLIINEREGSRTCDTHISWT